MGMGGDCERSTWHTGWEQSARTKVGMQGNYWIHGIFQRKCVRLSVRQHELLCVCARMLFLALNRAEAC